MTASWCCYARNVEIMSKKEFFISAVREPDPEKRFIQKKSSTIRHGGF